MTYLPDPTKQTSQYPRPKDGIVTGAQQRDVPEMARVWLNGVAQVVQAIAWIVGGLGIAGGLFLAVQTEEVSTGRYWSEEQRPYIGAGVGVIVAAVFWWAMLMLVGSAGRYLAVRDEGRS